MKRYFQKYMIKYLERRGDTMKRRLVKKKTYFKRFINAYSECGDTCTNRQTCGLI